MGASDVPDVKGIHMRIFNFLRQIRANFIQDVVKTRFIRRRFAGPPRDLFCFLCANLRGVIGDPETGRFRATKA